MEIASYQMLERVARKAGDKETVAVAKKNREEEEAMARRIDSKWNKIVDLTLKEDGIRVACAGCGGSVFGSSPGRATRDGHDRAEDGHPPSTRDKRFVSTLGGRTAR